MPKSREAPDGIARACAGIVLTRQMPGDAGVVFVTFSDETGVANVVVWPTLFERFRREVMGVASACWSKGKSSAVRKDVVHLVAERMIDRTAELDRLSEDHRQARRSRADASEGLHRHPRTVRAVPKSRDFH